MRVLVTGAAGYLGRAVVDHLSTAGHAVIALVRRETADLPCPTRLGDLISLTPPTVAGIDAVVHLAARGSVRESIAQPLEYWRTNVCGTLHLLSLLAPGTRFVFTSTGSVYGSPARQPIDEACPMAPLNPYGASKAAAEQLVSAHAATGAIGAVTLRVFNAAGAAGGRADRELSRIIPRAVAVASGDASLVTINGDGDAVRDFVHLTDIASAVELALPAAQAGEHRAYNLGAVPTSVAEIVAATRRVTGHPVPVSHRAANPDEAPELRADTSRIRAELGWAPQCTSIEQLIADQYSAWMHSR